MKRIIITGFVFLFYLSANAQYFGLQTGGLASNIKWRNDIYTVNTVVKPAFLAGITLDIPLKNTMAVNLALNYKWVGAALIDSTDLSALRLGYVNFDATYNYLFDMNTYQLYVEGGGYIGYLVNAQKAFKPENGDVTYEDLKIGKEPTDDILAMDIGVTIGAGVYVGNWKFGIGYMSSIIDLSPDSEVILRNKAGYLRVAYLFNRKKK